MERAKRTYFAWLNNAYAQEKAMARMYGMHADDASRGLNNYPETRRQLKQQQDLAVKHAKVMLDCLHRHQLKPNVLKVWLGEFMGWLLGITGDLTIDKIIMNNLTDSGMGRFEQMAYLTIAAAAEEMADEETAKTARQIMAEKTAKQEWLEKSILEATKVFLQRVKNR